MTLRIVEASEGQLDDWDDLVRRAPEGNVFQTRMWGQYWREYQGGTPHHWMAVTETGETVGVLLFLCDAFVWEPFFERPLGGPILAGLRRLVRRQHVNSGPLVIAPEYRAQVLAEFSAHLARQSRRVLPMTAVTLTTPVATEADDEGAAADISRALCSHGFASKEVYTHCIDLQVEEDDLWNGLHRSARKAVNRARREQITIRRIQGEQELSILHDHVKRARAQLGLRTFSIRNWTVMWDHLGPSEAVHMFVAEGPEGILAGLGVWSFGRTIQEFASALTDAGRSTTAGDLLKWEVILWGREHGYSYYDLAGLNPREDATDKEKQIARFKRKWGGRDVRVHKLARHLLSGLRRS